MNSLYSPFILILKSHWNDQQCLSLINSSSGIQYEGVHVKYLMMNGLMMNIIDRFNDNSK